MQAWKVERDLRISYEKRSSTKAFNLNVKDENAAKKVIGDLK